MFELRLGGKFNEQDRIVAAIAKKTELSKKDAEKALKLYRCSCRRIKER